MRVTFGIQVLLAVVILAVLTYGGWYLGQYYMYRPQAQPIAFPHDKHAGLRQIACQYCHRGVHHADSAGVPSVQECMDCHQVVLLKKPEPGQGDIHAWNEVEKLRAYWKARKPIAWFKVYQIPDHVRFSHECHIARGFDCSVCHGDVRSMRVLTQAHNPTMGFCVGCHRKYNAPTDCSTCHK